MSDGLRSHYTSLERRKRLLEEMVDFELLVLEGERRGLGESSGALRVRQDVMRHLLLREAALEAGGGRSSVLEAEGREYYERHPSEFLDPAKVRASHIQVESREEAERILETLKKGPVDMGRFRELAEAQREERGTQGPSEDLGYFAREPSIGRRGAGPPKGLRTAAFTLEIGQLFPEIVSSEAGHHIVVLTGKTPAKQLPYYRHRRIIVERLRREKRASSVESFTNRVMENAEIRVDQDAIASTGRETSAGKLDGASRRVVLATHKFGRLLAGQVFDALENRRKRGRPARAADVALKEVVDELLESQVLVGEAKRLGLEKRLEVLNAYKGQIVRLLRREVRAEVLGKVNMTDIDLSAYLESHRSEVAREEVRRASVVEAKSRSAAETILAQRNAPSQVDGRGAGALVEEIEHRDLGYFLIDGTPLAGGGEKVPSQLARAAFTMTTPGDTHSRVIEVDGRYVVLEITGLLEARAEGARELGPAVRHRVERKAVEEAMERLLQDLKTEVEPVLHLERLADVEV